MDNTEKGICALITTLALVMGLAIGSGLGVSSGCSLAGRRAAEKPEEVRRILDNTTSTKKEKALALEYLFYSSTPAGE